MFEAFSTRAPGQIHGVKNWRHPRLLRALRSPQERDKAGLTALFRLDESTFRDDDEDLHYATARYLCLWLDQRGKLWPFYRRFREHHARIRRAPSRFPSSSAKHLPKPTRNGLVGSSGFDAYSAQCMDQTRSADGTLIAFEKLGSGPSLILVGGAFCDHRARTAGLPLARALAGSMTVFSYDRRGRGGSGDAPPYAVAREVEDLAALLREAGGSAHVYGHSSGAILAFEAALAGLAVVKLALYEPPIVVSQERAPLPTDLVERLIALIAENKRSEATELFLTRAVGVPEAAVSQMKNAPHWAGLEALAHTLSYDARLAQEPAALLARASKLAMPTLVIAGARSQAWMRFGAEKLADALPAAQRVSLPEQTHDVDPAVLAPHLLEFFGPG